MKSWAKAAYLLVAVVFSIANAQADDEIEVTVGEEFTIAASSPPFAFPTLHQIGPEQAFVAIWDCPDASLPRDQLRQAVLYTEDGGKTWGKPIALLGAASGGHSSIRKAGGEYLWLSYFTQPIDAKTLACKVGRSNDGKAYSWPEGTIEFENPIRDWSHGNAYMVFARSMIELKDGSLLASMYGYFKDDPVYRCILVRSTDGGTTWKYYSTIAFSKDAPGEGYCEPVVQRTIDGDLLCVMRLQSGLPMASARSGDDGKTWSTPEALPEFTKSVFPDAVLMSNGVLALSYGRPGAHITFSINGMAHRWTEPTTVFAGTETCAYTAIREVAPGRLLYVYSYLEHKLKPGALDEIHGVFVDVKRKGIE